jgi:hypothetical protein
MGRARAGAELVERDLHLRVLRRAVTLKAAVLAYQCDHGRAPAGQEELLGGYLPRLPEDPFADGRPFGYRVSAGEELVGPPRASSSLAGVPGGATVVTVRAGQVVIWSVGQDHADDGGVVPPGGPRAKDLVFLVPAPPPPPR